MKEMLRKELIGCDIEVEKNKVSGKVIDETKNMLIIETRDGKKKKFIKKNNVFKIIINGKIVKVNGKKLSLRPEERIKIK